MPRVFVPGPSIGFNPGNPQQYIGGITDIANENRRNRLFADRTEETALANKNINDLNVRKQLFTEGANARARKEKLFAEEQENKKALSDLASVDASGFSFVDTFLQRPEAVAALESQGIKGDEAQRKYVTDLSKNDKSLWSDPNKIGDQAYRNVLEAGGNKTRANAARTEALSIWKTLPKDFATKLIDTSNPLGSTAGGTGKLFSGGKQGSAVQAAPAQKAEEDLRDIITERYGVEASRNTPVIDGILSYFNVGDKTRSTFDFGARDLDEGDIDRLVGTYGNDYPQHAIVGAMRSIVDPDDGTVDQKKWRAILDDPDSKTAIAFTAEIKDWQAKAERTRGGNALSGMTAKEILSIGNDLQRSQDARNMNIIGRTSPQASDFATRLAALNASFPGAVTNNTRQGDDQGGVETPEVVTETDKTSTGSVGLDNLFAAGVQEGPPGTEVPPILGQVDPKEGGSPGAAYVPGGQFDMSNINTALAEARARRGKLFGDIQSASDIQDQLDNMPPTIAQTDAQKKLIIQLEKELLELQ